MWLKIIFLFPDRLTHTGIASTAKPKVGSFPLQVQIYDPTFLVYTIRKMSCHGCLGVQAMVSWLRRISTYFTYTQMWSSEWQQNGEQRAAETESRKWDQGMISLFWARKNLQQLFCVQVGSDSQIKQSCSEEGVWPEEHHNDSALGVRLRLYVKETDNDDDDNVNNGHNLHLLGSFNATFSKLL